MAITIIRAAILYIFVILMVKLMGKRQIGQLQPAEFVITILISEIVTVPMQDNSLPLLSSVMAVLLLVSLEILLSAASLKFMKLRTAVEGNSIIVIRDGMIDQQQLKRLRLTIDDLTEALRQKDVFDISDVQYAIVETNGTLSVLLKPEKQTVTAEMLNINPVNHGMACTVISDGEIKKPAFKECNLTEEQLLRVIKKESLKIEDIMLMTADKSGKINVIRRDPKI